MAKGATKAGTGIARRVSHAGAKAKEKLAVAMKSKAAARAKVAAIAQRRPAMAFVGGLAYEEMQQRGIKLPKLPIPLSAEAQEAIALAFIADRLPQGIAREACEATSAGLAFTAGRNTRRTGSIGADADETVYV